MKRSYLIQIAHNILTHPNKNAVNDILSSVNLSKKEKEVICRSEIEKENIETICNSFVSWDKKSICSYSHACLLKKQGMAKIGLYVLQKKLSIT